MNRNLIPICQSRDNSNKHIKLKRYMRLKDFDDIDLRRCWKYFESNYECYCFKLKSNNTIENDLHNFYRFQLSFNELSSSGNGNKIFILKKDKSWFFYSSMDYYDNIHYVSNASGFAVILLSGIDLRVCYYDFDQKFTCHVKILSPITFSKTFNFLTRLFGLCHIFLVKGV